MCHILLPGVGCDSAESGLWGFYFSSLRLVWTLVLFWGGLSVLGFLLCFVAVVCCYVLHSWTLIACLFAAGGAGLLWTLKCFLIALCWVAFEQESTLQYLAGLVELPQTDPHKGTLEGADRSSCWLFVRLFFWFILKQA